MVPATSSSRAPISSASVKAAESSLTPAPTACTPSTTWLSARATTRTNPSSACSVIARPLARERKEAHPHLAALFSRRLGRKADADDFGIGKGDGGNRCLVEGALLARDDLRHHLALRHGAVGEHRLARQIADRPDVAHRGRERSSMRTNGPFMVRSSRSSPKPCVRGRRPTATRTFSASMRALLAVSQVCDRARPRAKTLCARAFSKTSTPRSASFRATGWVSSAS